VCLSGKSEELAIFSAKHRPWSTFDRVARLAERGETYVCHVCLPEIERAAPAVFHGLGRKRSHLASAEMVREEFEKFDPGPNGLATDKCDRQLFWDFGQTTVQKKCC
jgi:hypothetical protein